MILLGSPGKRQGLGEETGQWFGHGTEVLDETTVEVCHAEEDLNVTNAGRSGPGLDGICLLGIHADAITGDDVTEEFCGCLEKLAFVPSCVEFLFLK